MNDDFTITLQSYERGIADYIGQINGKPFHVLVRPDAAPHWYDSDLDDDERDEIINAINE
jgi:hypothetical protein